MEKGQKCIDEAFHEYCDSGIYASLRQTQILEKNSRCRVEREYGLGRKRTDRLLIWPHNDDIQEVVKIQTQLMPIMI